MLDFNEIIVDKNLTDTHFISKTNHHKVYFQGNFKKLKYGDKLTARKVHCSKPQSFYKNSTSFNFKKYLLGRKIALTCQIDSYDNRGKIFSLKYLILNWRDSLLKSLVNSNLGSRILISSLVLGEKNKNYSDLLSNSGTSHLFVISGAHIAVYIIFLNLTSNVIFSKYLYKNLFISGFLICFSIASGLNIPVLRAVLIYLLNLWIPQYNWFLPIFSISILLNPFLFFNSSFILSFLISYYINYFLQKNPTSTFKQYLIQNFELWSLSIPFQLIFNDSLNIFAPILNLFLSPFFSFIIIPITIITFLFPIKIFLFILNILFELIIYIITAFNYINTYLEPLNQVEFIIYYLLFFMYKFRLVNIKVFSICLSIFLVLYSFPLHDYALYLLDSKEIDCNLIQTVEKQNILINTGNNQFNHELTKFLKSKMVYHIDYLILTHDVATQTKNIPYLEQYFNIENIITPQNITKSSLPEDMSFEVVNDTLNLKYQNNNIAYYFLSSEPHSIITAKNSLIFSTNKKYIPTCDQCTRVITPETFERNNPEYYFPEKHGLLKVKLQ